MGSFKELLSSSKGRLLILATVVVIGLFFVLAKCSSGSDSSAPSTQPSATTQDQATEQPATTSTSSPSTPAASETTPSTPATVTKPGLPGYNSGAGTFTVRPDQPGTGSKYILPPPKNPISVNDADFPGGFPVPNGIKVKSSNTAGTTHTVEYWLPDPSSAYSFYQTALPKAGIYVVSARTSSDSLYSQFVFRGTGYGTDPARLTIKGSYATLVWNGQPPVTVTKSPPSK